MKKQIKSHEVYLGASAYTNKPAQATTSSNGIRPAAICQAKMIALLATSPRQLLQAKKIKSLTQTSPVQRMDNGWTTVTSARTQQQQQELQLRTLRDYAIELMIEQGWEPGTNTIILRGSRTVIRNGVHCNLHYTINLRDLTNFVRNKQREDISYDGIWNNVTYHTTYETTYSSNNRNNQRDY
jgi:hypothetical protein